MMYRKSKIYLFFQELSVYHEKIANYGKPKKQGKSSQDDSESSEDDENDNETDADYHSDDSGMKSCGFSYLLVFYFSKGKV